jgi:release factor glutamine methyltransferase
MISSPKTRLNALPNLVETLRAAEQRLALAGVDNARLDARILIAEALHLDRAQLLSQTERVLTKDEADGIERLIIRRERREPVARILGHREFWSLTFDLNEATLVPRPESETLVEAALWHFRERSEDPLRLLDLGTGSGCLLLALLHEFSESTGLGIDSAAQAIDQARTNAEKLGLGARATFRVNDWIKGIAERFDLIVSNPPYIRHEEIEGLMPEVRAHDPLLALDGGADGLAIYQELIPHLARHLKPAGAVLFEVGMGQAASVSALLKSAGFSRLETRKDLSGLERCLIAYIP